MLDISTQRYDINNMMSQYPKFKEALKVWFKGQAIKIALFLRKEAGVEGEVEISDEQALSSLSAYFEYNPRSLYEFFDSIGLPIEVSEFKGGWGVQILNWFNDNVYTSRFEAEKIGWDKASEMFERGLNRK